MSYIHIFTTDRQQAKGTVRSGEMEGLVVTFSSW